MQSVARSAAAIAALWMVLFVHAPAQSAATQQPPQRPLFPGELPPGGSQASPPPSQTPPPPSIPPQYLPPELRGQITLTDVTQGSGIAFRHVNGASGEHYYPEQMGGGAAFLDYDGDGWLDIFFVQGAPLPGYRAALPSGNALYRNNGNGTFTDVTRQAGLTDTRYGIGVVVGDYDNDGYPDLFVTNTGTSALYHNDGHGHFTDVTAKAGVATPAMSTSAAFLDYDGDGWLDLFVARYMDWSLQTDLRCGGISANGTIVFQPQPRSAPATSDASSGYCGPTLYAGTTQRLYRNNGNGTFTDVTAKAGIGKAVAHGMGVAVADYNEDGLPDIFVASDMMPNLLFLNSPGGVFREEAMLGGVAVPDSGVARAGMGVDVGDYDNDGHLDLFITNYENEPSSLYRGHGDGTFTDESLRSGISTYSTRYMKWGTRFIDFNLDGRLDIFVVNGHLDERAGTQQQSPAASTQMRPREGYQQQAQLYVADGPNHFADASRKSGAFFQTKHASRGAAFADFDNDGDWDVLVTSINDAPVLLRNDSVKSDRWTQLTLQGAGCNRDALGARVKVKTGVITQTQVVKSAGSYLSDHDRRLLFGLPGFMNPTVEIRWPCGSVQTLEVTPGKAIKIVEENCRLASRKPSR